MANKDLIKRALSVTANLAAAAGSSALAQGPNPAAPTEGERRDTEGSAVESRVPAGNDAAPTLALRARTPKTGPGSMIAFLADQSEVFQEATELRTRLAEFENASVAKWLDPTLIRPSKWANRDNAHFSTPAFERLKQEIASAGGNVQPIKVRPVAAPVDDAKFVQWEIVFGHRRHRACLDLRLPVLALVQNDMKDADLFVEMERENRERADLSAWEQGVMYLRALEMGLFPSAKQLALAIERDLGNIGKAMALAKLPAEVIQAFGTPLALQFRWATRLKDAHQRDPERLLAAARELSSRQPRPGPNEVFTALTANAGSLAAQSVPVVWKDQKNRRVAELTVDRKGRAQVLFDQPMNEAQQRKLRAVLDQFLDLQS